MGIRHDLRLLARTARDFGSFLRTPVDAVQGEKVVRRRLAEREERFLDMLQRRVYGHAASPYLRLLRAAGVEYGDVAALVRSEGVEGALSRLARDGVYVTFDEFKGRREVVRGSQHFFFAAQAFDNPSLVPHYEAQSGGSRGPGTAVQIGFPFVAALAANTALTFGAHGLWSHRQVIWLTAGVTPLLLYAKLGRIPAAWFYALRPLPARIELGARFLAFLGRRNGVPLPRPVYQDLMDPAGLAVWLVEQRRAGAATCVTTYASSAVRVAHAAMEGGWDLQDVCFITLGEPFTIAKQEIVTAAQARVVVRYAFTEGGIVGYGCGTPRAPDDLHFFSDAFALVPRRRPVEASLAVDAFLFTSLLSAAPKVLLNVENGDHGRMEVRSCGCALGRLGLTTHLRMIRSFEKLSAEGVTFAHSNLLHVLEEALPARFGGSATDYQLIEREERGVTRLCLLVSPQVGPVSEGAVRDAFLESLRGEGGGAPRGAEAWRRAGAVEVQRQWPRATAAGKILPLHLVRDDQS